MEPSGDNPLAPAAGTSQGYRKVLEDIRHAMPGELPMVVIQAENASVSVKVPVQEKGVDNLATALVRPFIPFRGEVRSFDVLKNVNVTVQPGSMTLVLAPPGHGRSALLKLLAGQLPATDGRVRWNTLTKEQAHQHGMRVQKLVAYADQVDVHLPSMTVRETLQFAVDHSFDPAPYNSDKLNSIHQRKVELVLRQLGLEECADTIVGNAWVRGVSGGQRKRVTLGEVLCSDARAVFLDEVTSGLDASTAIDVFTTMRDWVDVLGGSCVAALLQPGPELVQLFDQLILLREGEVVYSGSTSQVLPFFESVGLYKPTYQDTADFLVEFLTHPHRTYRRQLDERLNPQCEIPAAWAQASEQKDSLYGVANRRNSDSVQCITFHEYVEASDIKDPPPSLPLSEPSGACSVPLTTLSMATAYRKSPVFVQEQAVAQTINERSQEITDSFKKLHPLVQRQYGGEFSHSFLQHAVINLKRQAQLNWRDKGPNIARLFRAVLMGLVVGSMYYDLGRDEYTTRVALISYCMTCLAFASFVEIGLALTLKPTINKHYSYRLYPVGAQIVAMLVGSIPFLVLESVVFCTLVYWMTSFVADAGRFILFWVLLLAGNLSFGTLFRTLALISKRAEQAETLAGPVAGGLVLFGGFLIERSKIEDWIVWIYWISPFSWFGRAASLNEFQSSRYDEPLPDTTERRGDVYLRIWGMYNNVAYIWLGVFFPIFLCLLCSFISTLSLRYQRAELCRGTKRTAGDEEDETNKFAQQTNELSSDPCPLPSPTQTSALPFSPVTLAFKDVSFSVGKPDSDEEKVLLRNVSGFAEPGTLTALMGASGAGKTTLLDVLAGRKTQGQIQGQILINGHPAHLDTLNRVSGYVEQGDSHMRTSTVYETLMFSAQLRLPASVTDQQRRQVVEDTLKILELEDVRDRLLGEGDALSPGQLKRVTMGVELVANPSVLMLDEPTSNLDSRTALAMVKVIRQVARTGRAVVCTIHQPSAEVFQHFDRLLLLQSGGFPVFFGDLSNLESYMSSIPGVAPRPEDSNAATWMLDVIGAGTSLGREAKEANLALKLEPVSGRDDGLESPSVTSNLLMQQPDRKLKSQEVELLEWKASKDPETEALHNHAKRKTDRFNSHYLSSSLFKENELRLNKACEKKQLPTDRSSYARSFWVQYLHVQYRCFVNYWRLIHFNTTRFWVCLFIAIFFGLVWFDIDDTTMTGVNSKMSGMFMGMVFSCTVSSTPQFHLFFLNRAMFHRELLSRAYSSWVYSLSNMIIELVYGAAATLMFSVIFYFLLGLEADAASFFMWVLGVYMLHMILDLLAQVHIAVLEGIATSHSVYDLFFTACFLLSGIFRPGPDLPAGWKWVFDINPMRYVLQMLYITQFDCQEGCPEFEVVTHGRTYTATAREYISDVYGVDFGGYWWFSFGYLVMILAGLYVLTALATRYISHIKR